MSGIPAVRNTLNETSNQVKNLNERQCFFSSSTLLRNINFAQYDPAAKAALTNSSDSFWSKVIKRPSNVSNITPEFKRNFRLSIGGWLNLPFNCHNTLSLVLCVKDKKRELFYTIDTMNARGAQQILLSGAVEISIFGKVESVQLFCHGISDDTLWIDDLHFKAELTHQPQN